MGEGVRRIPPAADPIGERGVHRRRRCVDRGGVPYEKAGGGAFNHLAAQGRGEDREKDRKGHNIRSHHSVPLSRRVKRQRYNRCLPISQWCPNGSTTRPTRHPCWFAIDETTVAPAATAWSNTSSGSSTIISIRTVPPPRVSGLKFECCGDSSASQKSAPRTDNCATTSPCSFAIWNCSVAPNAFL